jgi:hypothetical protein
MRVILVYALFSIFGCSEIPAEKADTPYSPRNPGGNNGVIQIQSVTNATFDTSTLGQISLSWLNPSIYLFTNFNVYVYKRSCYYQSPDCTITTPTNGSVSVFQVYSGQNSSLIDTVNIVQGQNYTYWFYIEKDGVFDQGLKVGVATPIISNSQTLTDTNSFWQNLGFGIGTLVTPSSPFSAQTINSGLINMSYPSLIPGKTAVGKNGSVMYLADTDNNRVIVFAKQGALGCDIIPNKSSIEYQACIFQSANEPFVPVNVLGQPNQYSNSDCQTHEANSTIHYSTTRFTPTTPFGVSYAKCLTKPMGVHIDGNNLIISDTGNNRVVVHKGLPITIACDRNMSPLQTTSDNCAADLVIGKQGLNDLSNYPLLTNGASALNKPTSIASYAGNLYIVDSGNHRVVRVKGYQSTDYWSCDASTWMQPLCSFSGLLGQRTYFESKTFSQEIALGNLTFSSNLVSDPLFLGKYFENPTAIRIDESTSKLLVSSFENYTGTDSASLKPMQIGSRILVFNLSIIDSDTPSCNLASFSATGCSANRLIGQQVSAEIPVWSSASGTFESQVSYGLGYISDIELTQGHLVSVQPISNSVKIWENWLTTTTLGVPHTYNVLDPEGAANPTNAMLSLPDLEQISSVTYVLESRKFFIHDLQKKKVFEVTGYQ